MTEAPPAPQRPARLQLGEIALWALVLAAAAFVLLPAVVQWVEARQAETETRAARQAKEREVRELDRQLHWLVHDPQTDEKLQERYAISDRNGQD